MRTSEVYTISSRDIDLFLLKKTPHFYTFLIFDIECKVKISRLEGKKTIFFHVVYEDGTPSSVQVDSQKRWEFGLSGLKDLIEEYKKCELQLPKEGRDMFSNYKVTEVKFGAVNDVALETAVEKIASDLKDVEVKVKGEKTFLIKDGSAIELNGTEFQDLILKYVLGKTVSELVHNRSMFDLITRLGLIEEVKLEKPKDDLAAIFG